MSWIGRFLRRDALERDLEKSIRYGGTGGARTVSAGAARNGSSNEYIDYAATKGAIEAH